MKILPQVKVESINLDIVTEKALITSVDTFRFIHEENSNYVTVVIGEENYDFLDEIELEYLDNAFDMSVGRLEEIALGWIFGHVEIME